MGQAHFPSADQVNDPKVAAADEADEATLGRTLLIGTVEFVELAVPPSLSN